MNEGIKIDIGTDNLFLSLLNRLKYMSQIAAVINTITATLEYQIAIAPIHVCRNIERLFLFLLNLKEDNTINIATKTSIEYCFTPVEQLISKKLRLNNAHENKAALTDFNNLLLRI